MAQDTAEELERFRQQWQKEVSARNKTASSSSSKPRLKSKQSSGTASQNRAPPLPLKTPHAAVDISEDGESQYHDLENKDDARKLGESGSGTYPSTHNEPSSALEHFERAVEREDQGNLEDSLSHYRKAYRLDASVDRAYRNKHFPPTSTTKKQADTSLSPSNAPVTVTNTADHPKTASSVQTSDLIASFAYLSIPQELPSTDAPPPPPCPVADLPSEILTQILSQIALADPGSFARLALVCKRFAYLVATEDNIWRQVCHSRLHGFSGMHYTWACGMPGNQGRSSADELDDRLSALTLDSSSLNLPLIPSYPMYKMMYHSRPRVRFPGCYISTVNYIRPGAASATQATWNSPVLIVTYYRYLRFFRDGSCVSLLTTAEPIDVVHHLTKENMQTKAHASGLPTAVMNNALRGRWRLSGSPYGTKQKRPQNTSSFMAEGAPDEKLDSDSDGDEDDDDERQYKNEEEGMIHVETEGADAGASVPKYMYKMMLKLQNAGSAGSASKYGPGGGGKTRNNKLAWLGYWSYNRLTDDWAEFGLRNDRPFFWSRVKTYGDGE